MTQIQPRHSPGDETSVRDVVARGISSSEQEPRAERLISNAVVVYVILWILEGAIRKWVPSLDQGFYLARDALLVMALSYVSIVYPKRRRSNVIFWPFVLLLSVLTAVQVIGGSIGLSVALVGLRSYVAPLLLIYAVWRYRAKSLANRMILTLLVFAPLEAMLTVIQVGSPAAAWINKQVGDELTDFVNIGGIVRASGTFSAPSGLSFYAPLCLALSLAIFARVTGGTRAISGLAVLSSLTIVGIGGSRGAVLAVAIVLVVHVLHQAARSDWTSVKQVFAIAVVLVVTGVGLFIFVPDAMTALLLRFQNAATSENSASRLAGQTFGFLQTNFDVLGSGAGANSIAGVGLGSTGEWYEVESQRWVVELGILGLILALVRLAFVFTLVWRSFARLGDVSSMRVLLLAVWVPVILYGQITQNPTLQGAFSIMAVLAYLTWNDGFQGAGLAQSNRMKRSGQILTMRENGFRRVDRA